MNKKISIIYIVAISYFLRINNSYAFKITAVDIIEMNIYGNAECGMTDNRALYATFGYERQLFTCTHAIVGASGSTNRENKIIYYSNSNSRQFIIL